MFGSLCSCAMFSSMIVVLKKQYSSWKNARPHGVLVHHSCMHIKLFKRFVISFSFLLLFFR